MCYRTIWYAIIIALAGIVVFLLLARKTTWGRNVIDHIKLKMPVIGSIYNQLYISRATQTMGTMVDAGVPMLEMIEMTRSVTNNVYYHRLWDQVDERLRHGSQLSEPLFESQLVPQSVARMIYAGEKAGRLGQVMRKIAAFTEADFDESVRRSTQFIEPVMVMAMGLIIGGVAISLLLPIFTIGRVMAGN